MVITRGWEVTLKDGTVIYEGQLDWKKVPKLQIQELALNYMGRRWAINGKSAYFVNTNASIMPGVIDSLRIEKTTIGYYDGASKVCYTIDEQTGSFSIKVLN